MTAAATTADLVAWRLRALGLAGEPLDGLEAISDRLLALQGQDWGASRWALGVRDAALAPNDIVAAFDRGEWVRSWPMRGTVHLLAASELGWIQGITNHRVLAGAPRRRAFLGLDDQTLTRMIDIAVDRLTGGRSLSRDELAEAWIQAGIVGPKGDSASLGPWRYHVVWWMCQNGITVPGPVSDPRSPDQNPSANRLSVSEPRLVLAEEWIRHPRTLDGDDALAELARRFARGRGPVQDRDVAWWTGLTLREVRRGLDAALLNGTLTTITIDGATYWAEPALLDGSPVPAAEAPARLLPAFDEHLLGYTERSAVLDPEHFARIIPGRNGVFRPTIVEHGHVIGTWSRAVRGERATITLDPFPGHDLDLESLTEAASHWGRFHGLDPEIRIAK